MDRKKVQKGLAVKVEQRPTIPLCSTVPRPHARYLLWSHDRAIRPEIRLLFPLPRWPRLHLLDHEHGIKGVAVPMHEPRH